MSKDEWLDIIVRNRDFFLSRGLDPVDILKRVNDLKDRGVSDWTIISILVRGLRMNRDDIAFFLEEHGRKIVALSAVVVVFIFVVFGFNLPFSPSSELDLSKFEDPAVKPAELSFVKVSKYGEDTEVRIVEKALDRPIPRVKIAISDFKNHEGRYVAFAEDELRRLLNSPKGDLVFYNRHDSEKSPRFLKEGIDYKVVDFQGKRVYVIRFERFSTNTLTVEAWNGTYNIQFLNAVPGSSFSFNLSGNITNATVEFIGKGVNYNFDNANGGYWQKYINIVFSTPLAEYAQYRVEINGSYVYVYNVTGSLEASATTVYFWNLVKSDGSDIRIFNDSGTQLFFWIEYFNATERKSVIWVNVTAGSTELNIAYGNPLATKSAYEEGNQVFEFFDDFNDGVLDTNKWAISGTASVTESGGIVSVLGDTADDALYSVQTFSPNIVIVAKHKKDYSTVFGWEDPIALDAVSGVVDWHTAPTYNDWRLGVGNGTVWVYVSLGTPDTTNWHTSALVVLSTGAKLYRDWNFVAEVTQNQAISLGSVDFRSWSGQIDVDWVFVAKFADPADVSSIAEKDFATINPGITLNGYNITYNGTIGEGQSSGQIPINLSWLNIGLNNLTYFSDYGKADIIIRATYTDTVNLTITRELGVETQTFEYTPIENSTNVNVTLVFTATDLYHQLWNVTVNGTTWTDYTWDFPHLTIHLGNVTANVTYNITAVMGYNNPPIVVINDIKSVRGKSIVFSASVTDPEGDNIISWYWDFGDGTNSTSATPSHTYNLLGVYNCSVTVTDDGNVQSASTTVQFKVYIENQLPKVTLLEPANLDYIASETVQFSWSGSDPDVDSDTPYYYLYVDGKLVFEGYGETYTMTLSPGEHKWYVVVTDGYDTVKSAVRTFYVLSGGKLTSVPIITSAIVAPYPAVVGEEVYIEYSAFDPDGKIIQGGIVVSDPAGSSVSLATANVGNVWYGAFTPTMTGRYTITLIPIDYSGTSSTISIPLDVFATPVQKEKILEVIKTTDAYFTISKNTKISAETKLYSDRLIITAQFGNESVSSITLDLTKISFDGINVIEFTPQQGLSPLATPVELKIKLPIKALVVLNDKWNLIPEDYGVGSAVIEDGCTVITLKTTDTVTLSLIKNPSWIQELIHKISALIDSLLIKL